jgi:ribosomal subunit interface protein
MDVTLSSRHIDLTSEQQAIVRRKLVRLVRIVGGMDRAKVHFTEERNPRIAEREVCEVVLEGHGHQLIAKSSAVDPIAAVDATVEKLEHQLLSLKSRTMARYHGKAHKA